jgi:hypothetical protein
MEKFNNDQYVIDLKNELNLSKKDNKNLEKELKKSRKDKY